MFKDCILGLEFSGRNSQGKRVMGMLAARGLATSVLADPGFLWEVPSKWTLEQASTIPVVYGTVRCCIIVNMMGIFILIFIINFRLTMHFV